MQRLDSEKNFTYRHFDEFELASFMMQRRLTLSEGTPQNKVTMIDALEAADAMRPFHRFFLLPPEVRTSKLFCVVTVVH